jgi:Dolichyl-phosphate-mannose-protein mannosyltransferase
VRDSRLFQHLRSGDEGTHLLQFLAPVFATLVLLVWAACAALFDTAQYGDNIEQYIWSHSFEMGYHKHPPMPTWLVIAFTEVFGFSRWATLWLSTFCLTATLWLTWLVAKRLTNARVAAVSMVLWGLLQYFSSRLQMYNHNTVMVMWIAATLWCALNTGRSSRWWLGVGVAAGAAMLSKYQSFVPLTGILLGLAFTGQLQQRKQKIGLVVALLISLAVFAPHLLWVMQHDFITLRYASGSVETAVFFQRIHYALSFSVNQLRVSVPLVLTLILYCFATRFSAAQSSQTVHPELTQQRSLRVWMWALFIGPLAFLLLLALVAGVHLRNQWGLQILQFAPLCLASWLCRRKSIHVARLAVAALAIHAANVGLQAFKQHDTQAMASQRRLDTMFPAQKMADAGAALWRSVTPCPLRLVAGDFEAGLVSLYSGRSEGLFPAIHTNAVATPWIKAEQLRLQGALWVLPEQQHLPPGVAAIKTLYLGADESPYAGYRSVTFAVQLPAQPCKAS